MIEVNLDLVFGSRTIESKSGTYKGFTYMLCVNGFASPYYETKWRCAYVCVPQDHKLYHYNSMSDIPICCHGGCTYLHKSEEYREGTFSEPCSVVGWDYNHYNDDYYNITETMVIREIMEVIDNYLVDNN